MLKQKCSQDPCSNVTSHEWKEYFDKLLNTEQTNNFTKSDLSSEFSSCAFECLNKHVTAEEVLMVVRTLKTKTSSGVDEISNAILKTSCLVHVDIYVNIFNYILKSGVYPNKWKENLIKPLFKGGSFCDPSNYRGIALSSCFSTFLSKLLCNRLDKFLNENRIICDEQIGFKKGCRTSDHILSLKTLIDKAFKKSKYLYCCFIDLRKAFDIVSRTDLFAKLSQYNIQGNFLQVLKICIKRFIIL